MLHTHTRDHSLDSLRGFAILTMVAAHTIAFLNFRSDWGHIIQWFGDTVSFTIFLIVSAASAYISYARTQKSENQLRIKLIDRVFLILGGYYLIAIVVGYQEMFRGWINIPKIMDTILLIDIPMYSEFLISFILFSILHFKYRKEITKIVSNPKAIIIISAVSYFLGYVLYIIPFPFVLENYKSLIAGHYYWPRFPILQYIPIYLIGCKIGYMITHNYSIDMKYRKFKKFFIWSSLFLILCLMSVNVSRFPYANTFERWPPSVSFLTISSLFAVILFLIFSAEFRSNVVKLFMKSLANLGRLAFLIFVIHLLILYSLAKVSNVQIDSGLVFFLMYIGVLSLSYGSSLLIKEIFMPIVRKWI